MNKNTDIALIIASFVVAYAFSKGMYVAPLMMPAIIAALKGE